MAGLALENVSRVYPGGVQAVDRLSLEIHDGELLVLVGPSGCGKSTTLRMIAGLEEVSAGTIRIGGRVVNGVGVKERNIAMMFQENVLYPHWSVYRNMAFGLELREGKSRWTEVALRLLGQSAKAAKRADERQNRDAQVRQAARLTRVEGLLDRRPRQLSGGEKQRVALGRAVVRKPAAFLFDEPLSNLDASLRLEVRGELKQLLRQMGATVLWVTHDQAEAIGLGDRIAVMNGGVLQQAGSAAEVYERPANQFVAGFLGTPAMNFLHGRLEAAEQIAWFRWGECRLRLPGGELCKIAGGRTGEEVILGIRPEQIDLGELRAPGESGQSATPDSDQQKTREPTLEENSWLAAVVMAVEPLGDSTLLHLAQFNTMCAQFDTMSEAMQATVDRRDEVRCRVPSSAFAGGRPQPVRGDRVGVRLDLRRAQLFDPRTGVNLSETR